MIGLYVYMTVILLVQIEQRAALLYYIREHKELKAHVQSFARPAVAVLMAAVCLFMGGCVDEQQLELGINWASENGWSELVLVLSIVLAVVVYRKSRHREKKPGSAAPSDAETDKIGEVTNVGNVLSRVVGWINRLRKKK